MTETYVCRLCKRSLPVEAYQFHRARPGEKAYRRHACKDCLRLRRDLKKPEPTTGKRRVCKRCGKDKPLSAYYLNSSGGRFKTCKPCMLVQQAAWYRRVSADPAFMDAYRARKRRWAKRRTRARMAALLERVNAAMSDQLRASNGSAKMRCAGPADSQVPITKWPGAVASSPDREPRTTEVR